MTATAAGEDARPDQPTRQAPHKWVIVVDRDLGAGLVANAVACVAASTGAARPEIIGPYGIDGAGTAHPGLPWAGCSILATDQPTLRELRAKATTKPEVLVVDMPEPAQTSRVYDDYLAELARTTPAELIHYAISLAGPRNTISKLVGKLALLR